MIGRYRRELSVAVAYGLILLLLAVAAPRFFGPDQLRAFVVSSAPVLVAAVGMTLVILCRQIDISIGSIFSICGVVAGLLAQAGLPIGLVALGTLLAGGLLGAINGVLVARLGLAVDRGDARHAGDLARIAALRARGRIRPQPAAPASSGSGWARTPASGSSSSIALVVFAASPGDCDNLAAGRFVYATGSDPEAARLAGIRPRRVVFAVFVTMGALAGLAALLNAVRFADVDPNSGAGLELQVIAAVVVGGVAVSGGRGTLAGSCDRRRLARLDRAGPRLPGHQSPPGVPGAKPQWEKAIQGLIILLAVASDSLLPGGTVR